MTDPTASPSASTQRAPQRGRRSPRCCACCLSLLAILFMTALGLWAVMAYRARWEPVPLPPRAVRSPNARDYFVRAYELLPKDRHLFPISMPRVEEETYDMYRLAAADAAPALAELRKGLKIEYGPPPDRIVRDRADAQCRELARTLSGMARYHELDGRHAEAAECLLDGMEMGVMVPRGGPLISSLVGFAIEVIGMHPMERILPKLSASELAHVAERLDRIEARATPFADILIEEGYTSAATWQKILRDFDYAGPRDRWGTLRSLYPFSAEGQGPNRIPGALAFVLADRPGLIREQIGYYIACAEAARKPFTGKLGPEPPTLDRIYRVDEVLAAAFARDASRRALRAVLRTEVALLRYRMAKGQFPESLGHLVPDYLNAVSDDPCGGAEGRPLRYRVSDDGASFVLYSLGPDLKDDDGTPLPKGPTVDESGDIVAGKLWPQRDPRPVKGAPVP